MTKRQALKIARPERRLAYRSGTLIEALKKVRKVQIRIRRHWKRALSAALHARVRAALERKGF